MSEQELRDAHADLNVAVDEALAKIDELAQQVGNPDVTPQESAEIAANIRATVARLRAGISGGTTDPGNGGGGV